jgi:AbrB family looped-hinge helix DNA binding protein
VIFVGQIVVIDRQGRLVIPAEIREKIGMKNGGRVSVRLDGSKVIIEPVFEDLEERVQRWREFVMGLSLEPFKEDVSESWKWMSHEYARRKLGLI